MKLTKEILAQMIAEAFQGEMPRGWKHGSRQWKYSQEDEEKEAWKHRAGTAMDAGAKDEVDPLGGGKKPYASMMDLSRLQQTIPSGEVDPAQSKQNSMLQSMFDSLPEKSRGPEEVPRRLPDPKGRQAFMKKEGGKYVPYVKIDGLWKKGPPGRDFGQALMLYGGWKHGGHLPIYYESKFKLTAEQIKKIIQEEILNILNGE
tara:strand:+ start:1426 stop:2031 length:606 start_codon:yes stop_codon:yes gene_type:complete